MGSTGGTGLATPPPPPPVVCCMCGDPGLPVELFRCKVCHFRSQHKYCSDLYPKAETYKACNWCLREERGKALARELATAIDSSAGPSGNGNGSLGWKLQRGASPLQLSKPVKKQRVPERGTTASAEKMRTDQELSPGAGRVRQTFRGKVRRYKLLEEVSS
ncbi:uncharacterized protein LOC110027855 [Phalaenopsis equestris]|uniref:uncharacterized protein LOC110027855 n=1 Tax=Phalaenopsis equestris TaxID=78828 RepID=UPI0009E19B32|nr:uncharacterized protein LOC110027855 [Phalaenopsis equestris]